MSTSLQLFEHPSFGQVCTIERDGGEILFCGKDVVEALGYKDPTNALKLHYKGVANWRACHASNNRRDAQKSRGIS